MRCGDGYGDGYCDGYAPCQDDMLRLELADCYRPLPAVTDGYRRLLPVTHLAEDDMLRLKLADVRQADSKLRVIVVPLAEVGHQQLTLACNRVTGV
jgi:hypothetical protein